MKRERNLGLLERDAKDNTRRDAEADAHGSADCTHIDIKVK